jgi:D-glycero-alpha-D-manno-heptose-7-phosphate kinase
MAGMADHLLPLRIVRAVAPTRICDNGGWTDTWFAGHGKVFNIGVYPCVEVQLKVRRIDALPARIVLHAENYAERYAFEPRALPDRHPLLEATIDEAGLPHDVSVEINIYSEAPAGCSTGTSAAVTVALIGAFDSLTPGRMAPHEVAYAAHRIEVERLGVQSGIQDQLCSVYGGINYIEMSAYPHASVSQLSVANNTWWELERRLLLVYLGCAHASSAVHDRVIASLAEEGGDSPHLDALRRCAEQARDATYAADLPALGGAMTANTEAQGRLHPSLVSDDAHRAIEAAAAHGALGWKVNGAGGDGGSITILCGPDMSAKRDLAFALRQIDSRFQIIPTYLSRHGLRVWHS